MDDARSINLSRALSALHLVSAKWATIDLGEGWGIALDSDPSLIAVHFVLAGKLEISIAHGEPQQFFAGQSFILPNGAPHVVRTGAGSETRKVGPCRD